jgi:hypothetical protein
MITDGASVNFQTDVGIGFLTLEFIHICALPQIVFYIGCPEPDRMKGAGSANSVMDLRKRKGRDCT